tara:strand:+ start:512 stop:2386 length:1875 start_codon:yes stop_codon:yes gene_type:complete
MNNQPDVSKKEKDKDLLKKKEAAQKEAEIRAYEKLSLEKILREQREKKIKEKEEKDKDNETKSYKLEILYTIEKFSNPKKIYTYQGNKKNTYSIIEVGDEVIYNNPKHPNHLKEGIVRKFNKQGGLNFEIIFNDPPFLWEKNPKTEETFKTQNKIKIIQNVKFKNLRKKFNLKNIKIELPKTFSNEYKKLKFNKREIFNKPILGKKMKDAKLNNILLFYKTLLFLNDLELKYDKKEKIGTPFWDVTNYQIEEKLNLGNNNDTENKNDNDTDNKNDNDEIIKKNFIEMRGSKTNNSKLKLSINKFYYLFNEGENENEIKKKFDLLLRDEKDTDAIVEQAFAFFDRILLQYNLTRDDFQLNNKEKIYIFYRNIINEKEKINQQTFFKYQDLIENKIKETIEKEFINGSVFYPEEVKVKYTNYTSLENQADFFNNPDKLVKPTDEKIFTIAGFNENSIKKIENNNDFEINKEGKEEKVEKIFRIKKIASELSPGIIEVLLNIKLNMKDLKTKEELSSETTTSSAFRMVGDFLSNLRNKLDCEENKEEFYKNLKELGKKFDKAVSVPKINTDEEEKEETYKKIKIPIITQINPKLKKITQYIGGNKKKSIKIYKKHKGGRKKSLKVKR